MKTIDLWTFLLKPWLYGSGGAIRLGFSVVSASSAGIGACICTYAVFAEYIFLKAFLTIVDAYRVFLVHTVRGFGANLVLHVSRVAFYRNDRPANDFSRQRRNARGYDEK